MTFVCFPAVFSDGAALGQVQSALEQQELHRGHLPQEQISLDGVQHLHRELHVPRHRVLGVSSCMFGLPGSLKIDPT